MKTALLALFCTAAFGQNSYNPPRTPYGQPDLQGVWDFRTITPLERSKELGTKAFFTPEEAAKYEQEQNRRQNRDLIDPEQGGLQYAPPSGRLLGEWMRRRLSRANFIPGDIFPSHNQRHELRTGGAPYRETDGPALKAAPVYTPDAVQEVG